MAARETGTLVYDLVVVGAALAFTALAVLLWGAGREALATSLGGTLAVLNWLGLRWLGARLLGARPVRSGRRKALLAVLFVLKFGVLIGAVWVLIRRAGLDPAALALGYSALVAGLLGAALLPARERAEGGSDA
ncbi:MAG: hypothetical protein GYA57_10695 [Myxococcales bacterium]|nr:hypothetical protein [Myxococcales bacterium]